jgi:glycosyltransferase involved in cell wall biosynthesis
LIDEGKNGYLVEPRQPSTIASCLLKMKANLDETREMGKQSRRKVEEHFSWDSIARLTLDEIKRTIPSSL